MFIPPPLRASQKDDPFIWTQWFVALYNALVSQNSLISKASNPTVADIQPNEWQLYKNTTTGVVKLWVNDNGTLKSTTLT